MILSVVGVSLYICFVLVVFASLKALVQSQYFVGLHLSVLTFTFTILYSDCYIFDILQGLSAVCDISATFFFFLLPIYSWDWNPDDPCSSSQWKSLLAWRRKEILIFWCTECQERPHRPSITEVPLPHVRLLNVTCSGLLWITVIMFRHLNGAPLLSETYWMSSPSAVLSLTVFALPVISKLILKPFLPHVLLNMLNIQSLHHR